MNRRHFMQTSLTGVAFSALTPHLAKAETVEPSPEGHVYYTRAKPGRWAKKAEGHLPRIEVEKTEGGIKVKVTTPHEMRGHEHYIIKHVLLDARYDFIEEKLFDPARDTVPVSEFTLKDPVGSRVYVLSLCNLHDLWLASAEF